MKRILSVLLCLSLLLAVFAGCSPDSATTDSSGTPAADGAQADSSVFRRLYSQEFTTLNYLYTSNANELKILANVVDCLVEYDTYGVVKPSLAESWEHNDDYTVWTFKIRQGVKWVDKDGKEVADVTANDWVSAAHYVNDAHSDSALQYMYDGIIKDAQTYYEQTASTIDAEEAVTEGKAASVEEYYAANDIDPATFIGAEQIGVKALDDYTLEFTMDSECPYFVSVLSYSSYMPVYGPFIEEQGQNFGIDNETLLYNGPYILSEYEPQVKRILKKNPSYWDAGNVFIDSLEYTYNAQDLTLAPTMFQRGEIDYAEIGADILDEWLKDDATKNIVRPSVVDISYSYFYTFNFEPRFADEYEPNNWMIAVNNENFRHSIMSALDRKKALSIQDPYNPESLMNNTITPLSFAVGAGKDYAEYEPLAKYTSGDSFDETAALAYKEIAKTELEAAGCTFPVKIPMLYNPSTFNWDKEVQVVEQQLEALLGTDYIDVIVEAGPSTGFLSEVRRSGKYALMKCNYGADFADPLTFADPFKRTNTYNFMHTDEDNVLSDIPATNKTATTQAIVNEYYTLIDAAKAITKDAGARYEAFAKAEAFLIEHAIIIPFSVDTYGYVADLHDPFDVQFAPYGVPIHRFKGRKLLDKPMSMEEFKAAYETWETARTAAIAAAQ